jgi:hypothetical protein
MSFPFKGNSSCTSPPLNAPSGTPNLGYPLSSGPSPSGGIQSMLSIYTQCQCSTPPCCGPGGPNGPDGPPGIGGLGGTPRLS